MLSPWKQCTCVISCVHCNTTICTNIQVYYWQIKGVTQQYTPCWVRGVYLAISGWVSVYSSMVNFLKLVYITTMTGSTIMTTEWLYCIQYLHNSQNIFMFCTVTLWLLGVWKYMAWLDRPYCFPATSYYIDKCWQWFRLPGSWSKDSARTTLFLTSHCFNSHWNWKAGNSTASSNHCLRIVIFWEWLGSKLAGKTAAIPQVILNRNELQSIARSTVSERSKCEQEQEASVTVQILLSLLEVFQGQ